MQPTSCFAATIIYQPNYVKKEREWFERELETKQSWWHLSRNREKMPLGTNSVVRLMPDPWSLMPDAWPYFYEDKGCSFFLLKKHNYIIVVSPWTQHKESKLANSIFFMSRLSQELPSIRVHQLSFAGSWPLEFIRAKLRELCVKLSSAWCKQGTCDAT